MLYGELSGLPIEQVDLMAEGVDRLLELTDRGGRV